MRKLIVAIAVALSVLVLASCGGPSAPAPIAKAIQTQVTSDIAGASEAYQCQFVQKSLYLLGSFKANGKKHVGETVYVFVVTFSVSCQGQVDNGTVLYYVTVDKAGKVVSIA